MKHACVIGWPVAHSRSPLIHGYWLSHYGIKGTYERIAVPTGSLARFVDRIRSGEFTGCNVTLPHKEAVAAFLDTLTPQAMASGSVNTIYREGKSLVGTSTDGQGFAESVMAKLGDFTWTGKRALVLGAGGSARAIIAHLLERGVLSVYVWNRTAARAIKLSSHFGTHVSAIAKVELESAANASDIIINTTSAELGGGAILEFPFDRLSSTKVFADIVYIPLVTPFLRSAESHGHAVVSGLGMLLHQAVPGFQKWFGVRAEVTPELYQLVAGDIEKGNGT
jgi:shikimate dehydrogenase